MKRKETACCCGGCGAKLSLAGAKSGKTIAYTDENGIGYCADCRAKLKKS